MTHESLKTRKPKRNVITIDYNGLSVSFDESAWFNATAVADRFGKRPNDWLALDSTKEYLTALADVCNTGNPGIYIKTQRGQNGGTWLSPELAVPFARWLDVRFSIWCDRQIKQILSGSHPYYDWKRARSEAASSFKVMNAVLQLRRQDQSKPTEWMHYSNEARLVNRALTGEYKGLNRDTLSDAELDLLAKLEERNAVLIGCGFDSASRKQILDAFVTDQRKRIAA